MTLFSTIVGSTHGCQSVLGGVLAFPKAQNHRDLDVGAGMSQRGRGLLKILHDDRSDDLCA